jgi:hypothetical protein
MNFLENPPSKSQDVPSGQTDRQAGRQTDRHNEGNSSFFQEFVSAPNRRKPGFSRTGEPLLKLNVWPL